ncbi:MAG: hypothetical protein C5B48_05625 [Candidatus Rokuibacteriota bacterium]|nr:MAG: hypothetical protein C5B48_05625 [Candidatus Rokubacteria bacterium]
MAASATVGAAPTRTAVCDHERTFPRSTRSQRPERECPKEAVQLTPALSRPRRNFPPSPEGTYLVVLVGGLVLIPVLGALVAVHPRLAIAAAALATAGAILVRVANRRIAAVLVAVTVLVVGLVDLPRQVSFGPASLYGWITVLLATLLLLVSVSRYVLSELRGLAALFAPLYAFALWALISMVWFKLSFAGLQNTLVYTSFATLIPVTAAVVLNRDFEIATLRKAITGAILLASALYGCSLATGGLGGSALVGARSYALLGVIGVAWGAAHARFGNKRLGLLAGLCCLLVLLSLSRTAFAASMLILVVVALDLRTPARFVRSALLVGSVAAVAYFSITSFGPLAARFQQGDVHSIGGGVSINVSGRAFLWGVAWRDSLKSPIVGQGAGSIEQAITREQPTQSQPHNDFLRVFHDFGIIGLGLLVVSFVGLFAHPIRATRATPRGDPTAPLHLAAGLAMLGLVAAMTTDNAIVYLFVVAPVAVIIGLSIGAFGLAYTSGGVRRGSGVVPGTPVRGTIAAEKGGNPALGIP